MTISLLVLELRKHPHLSFAQYLETGTSKEYQIGTNVSNKMLLNTGKSQVYRFYHFSIIKGKPKGGEGVKLPPPTHPTRLGLIIRTPFNAEFVII